MAFAQLSKKQDNNLLHRYSRKIYWKFWRNCKLRRKRMQNLFDSMCLHKWV